MSSERRNGPPLREQFLVGFKESLKTRLHFSPPMAIFIDGPNLSGAASRLNIHGGEESFDFEAIKWLFSNQGGIPLLRYYVDSDNVRENRSFYLGLENLGWTVVQSVCREGHGRIPYKEAPVDHELITDLCLTEWKTANLVSGDGDFAYAVARLAEQGRKINVIANKVDMSQRLHKLGGSHDIRFLFLDQYYPWLVKQKILA